MDLDGQFYRLLEPLKNGSKAHYQKEIDLINITPNTNECSNAVKGLLNVMTQIKQKQHLKLNAGYNKYIVKAYNFSRGNGISTHDNLKTILDLRYNKKTK